MRLMAHISMDNEVKEKKESAWKWGFLRKLPIEERRKYLEESAKLAAEMGLYEEGHPNSILV